jgi:hypothetical protein
MRNCFKLDQPILKDDVDKTVLTTVLQWLKKYIYILSQI